MTTLVNSVQLIGRLGADVEIKTTARGTKVCRIRMATNEYNKNSMGDWNETTHWHTLIVWGKLAEKLEKTGKKGSRLAVKGSLAYREYIDASDIKREVTEIRVNQFMLLDKATETFQNTKTTERADLPF
ncbi:single-stranded DNA-binding protein [Sphingobacterium wenxiniae]|uniref:Single-stranded DNA-binding protein n=1 Tax=Sphingobacterium wenxiniae TaxID=683125 RepID=A0A1I6Q520_9SPHI|nr:single-stranded DNA-binding protein [Sphingobacterium wenxiniae]SFS47566.1 single-strand DNA-binding protein [Sphingobacterium wenxiniae]